jgi:hypothetical protein
LLVGGHGRMETMKETLVDQNVYELAEMFCDESGVLEIGKPLQLAKLIQKTIEDWLSFEQEKKKASS